MGKDIDHRHDLPLLEAAAMIGVTSDALVSMTEAGFVLLGSGAGSEPRYRRADLKGFLARNADSGSGHLLREARSAETGAEVDPELLLAALDGRSDDMARRAFDLFCGVFPEASHWSLREQSRFISQAKERFEAILAITAQENEVDDALLGDLQDVGADAAWSGSPLPHLLVILRISRDLVVQTAVEVAEERAEEQGRHWGLALSLLLTRILPAIDRLTDSLAQGYWAAILGREEEAKGRYQAVVESSSDGIYDIDIDGTILYANASLAVILGRRLDQLQGRDLGDVLVPLEPAVSVSSLTPVTEGGEAAPVTCTVARPDGVRRVLQIVPTARRLDGELIGFQGVVHDITTAHDLEADKNEFLALVTYDLRNPLTTVLGLGATLESHGEELAPAQVARMGGAIRRQAERMSRLADDLYDVSRLEAHSLVVKLRTVDLADAAESALQSVESRADVEIRIPRGITVLADPRRLEQVIANLVDNALYHGAAPVTIEVVGMSGIAGGGRRRGPSGVGESVTIVVEDRGGGVPPALVPTLFSGLRTLGRRTRDRSRGTGLGLALVRGLAEAMGGSVRYEPGQETGARFLLSMPLARS